MAVMLEDKGPERGDRPLSGLTRRGTSLQSDYGVIRRRPLRNEAANTAFQGKAGLQIGNVQVRQKPEFVLWTKVKQRRKFGGLSMDGG